FVDLRVLGRDHDDGHPTRLAKRSAEVEPAHAGQHQVKEDEVRARGPRGPQPGRPIARLVHRETRCDEVVLQHLADAFVVLDDEHAACAAVGAGPAHPSSTTCPDSRKTMSSATLVTRSEMRSRLWATRSSVTDRRASSVSPCPLPISLTRSSKTRWYRRSTSLSRAATSRARGSFWS